MPNLRTPDIITLGNAEMAKNFKIGNSTTLLLVLLDHGFKPGLSHIHGLTNYKFELFPILVIRTIPGFCFSNLSIGSKNKPNLLINESLL